MYDLLFGILIFVPITICPFIAVHYLVLAIKAATDKEATEDWRKYSKISGFAFMLSIAIPFILLTQK